MSAKSSRSASILARMENNILTEDASTWLNMSLLSVTQISPGGLKFLCDQASQMKQLVATSGGDNRLAHKVLCTLFYEVSTRTSCSFQAAMLRLGGSVIHVDANAASSTQKGESLPDTLTCLGGYADIIVLRTSTSTEGWTGASRPQKPIINAGDGIGEHPTQALLDFFTMRDELGDDRLMYSSTTTTMQPPLTVIMLGDLKNGRTVHSLAKLLVRCGSNRRMKLIYCSPPSLSMPQYVKDFVSSSATVEVEQVECTNVNNVLMDASPDVLYVTRIQRERFHNEQEYENVKGSYVINAELLANAPSDMIVLHPLPRVDEIDPEVDDDPRAAYFRQAENGMYVRMALLALLLGKGE